MGMTIENGAKEVADRSASTVGEAANIFAKGLLMGAPWKLRSDYFSVVPRIFSKRQRQG